MQRRPVGLREEIEALVLYWPTPESFKPLRLTPGAPKLRARLLRYRVMMAVVWSLVYPRMDGLGEVVRVLEPEGWLWLELSCRAFKLYI